MFGKLAEAQKKMQEIKNRLGTITVTGESGNGKVIVEATGNNRVKSIKINDSLFKVGLLVPIGPPNISSNSTSITSSSNFLPDKVFAGTPSKKVVAPVVETFNTSVTNKPVKVAAS